MKEENQSRLDEKIRKLNEQYGAIQVEVAQLMKENARLKKENARLKKEHAEPTKETDRRVKDTEKPNKEVFDRLKEIEEMIMENGKEIGGLSEKYGGYPEAMARPSIRRILEERFDAVFLGPILITNSGDDAVLEVDAWGRSRNGMDVAYIMETKSKFRDEHIEQVWQLVERFRYNLLAYREERAVYPMLAVTEISEEQRRRVWAEGIYLIDIDDGVFRYAKPPQDFEPNGCHGIHRAQRSVSQLRVLVDAFGKPRRAE